MGRRFDDILPCGLAAFPLDKIKGAYYIRNPLSIYPNKTPFNLMTPCYLVS